MRKILFILVFVSAATLVSCSYSRLLKSTDHAAKYKYALNCYEHHDYNRTLELFDVLQSYYRGKAEGEEIAYLTGECYFNLSEYMIASQYYKRYAATYPFASRTPDALFKSAYCYYKISPNQSLDQKYTHQAISEFQQFIDAYPSNKLVERANGIMDTLRMKLEEKDFATCKLYYKTGEYLAAVTSFDTFLKDYPGTSHREEILYYMILTYCHYALESVEEKQKERFDFALEKYNTLIYVYPESQYTAELDEAIAITREKLTKKKK